VSSGIQPMKASSYSRKLISNGVDTVMKLIALTPDELKNDIGISILGDRISIRILKERIEAGDFI